MDLLPALVLRILHFLYALISLFFSFWKRQRRPRPQPLQSPRRRLPANLALIFVTDTNIPSDVVRETILQSLLNAVEWCRCVGIPKLTVYEEHGLILQLEPQLRATIFGESQEPVSSDSETEYEPLTPPASICSESPQLSPCHSSTDLTKTTTLQPPMRGHSQRGKISSAGNTPVTLCLLSSKSSKTAIANVARSLYFDHMRKPRKTGQRTKTANLAVTIDTVDSLLESDAGLSSPDFMVIHPINPMQYNRTPLELHGFPPWHIRLTEIHLNKYQDQVRSWRHWLRSRLTYTPNPTVLDEASFRNALDEFAEAEMRFGK